MVVSTLALAPLLKSNCSAKAGAAPRRAMARASGRALGRAVFMRSVPPLIVVVVLLRGAIVHSCDGLEKSRRAHAGADAHRHHAVALAGTFHAMQQRRRADRAGRPEGMT